MSGHKSIVHLFAPGPIGGAEKVLLSGLKAFSENGHDFPLWIIKESRVPKVYDEFKKLVLEQNISSRSFISKKRVDFSLLKELRLAMKEQKPALIHAHGIKAAFYAYLTCPKNTKLIITHHGVTSHNLLVKVYEYIELLAMRKANCVISVSDQMQKDLIAKKISKDKITTIENLLSFNSSIRQAPKNDCLELLYVGRLSYEKGLADLFFALKGFDNFKLTIVGDGIIKDELIDLAQKYQIYDHLKFMGFQKNVLPFMQRACALIMPSLREGLPMTLIEAVCTGIPVLASNVGGIPKMVKDNGILFEPQNSEQIKDAIAQFEQKREYFQMAAIERAHFFREQYSQKKWVDKTLNCYETVLRNE